ncbi:ornithine decarboxylase antizyme [Elysia marginata]|uniref:Ornithine decarboxylase antizyme n=1 Tax=Elysia marginata TaxID=1093978 RepID=A0AAV4I8E0_9GAST|nr:ornithine decarboxylase antizyme [Elysia marginata]
MQFVFLEPGFATFKIKSGQQFRKARCGKRKKRRKKRCQPYIKKTSPTPSLLYLWAPGLCGGPDEPHVALECRTDLAEGNDVGVFKAPPVSADNLLNDLNNSARNKNALQVASNLTFKISPIPGLEVAWETTLINDALYVELPSGILPEGSKESLVTLLEYAEEKLKCKYVVLCFNKNRTDRVSLLRVFNFFGFQVLAPSHPLVVSPSNDLMFMAYTIERDSEEEDEEDDSEVSSSEEEEEEEEEDARNRKYQGGTDVGGRNRVPAARGWSIGGDSCVSLSSDEAGSCSDR